jgi:hypothetical protein
VEIIRIAKENLGLARIALWCNRLSWVILAFAVLLAVLRFAMFLISSLPPWGGPPDQPLFSILLYLLSQLENILYAGFTFFLLQGMAAILSLLIDIRMLSGLAPAVEEGMESQA